jgi:hypothetical protein
LDFPFTIVSEASIVDLEPLDRGRVDFTAVFGASFSTETHVGDHRTNFVYPLRWTSAQVWQGRRTKTYWTSVGGYPAELNVITGVDVGHELSGLGAVSTREILAVCALHGILWGHGAENAIFAVTADSIVLEFLSVDLDTVDVTVSGHDGGDREKDGDEFHEHGGMRNIGWVILRELLQRSRSDVEFM